MSKPATLMCRSARTTSEVCGASHHPPIPCWLPYPPYRRSGKPSHCHSRAPHPLTATVSNKQSSEIYLEGTLERGIIPDESTWIAGQGSGEDGFMLFLQKMNLELLQKCARTACALGCPCVPGLQYIRGGGGGGVAGCSGAMLQAESAAVSRALAGIGCTTRCGGPSCSLTTPTLSGTTARKITATCRPPSWSSTGTDWLLAASGLCPPCSPHMATSPCGKRGIYGEASGHVANYPCILHFGRGCPVPAVG